jgi:hypothetical protein
VLAWLLPSVALLAPLGPTQLGLYNQDDVVSIEYALTPDAQGNGMTYASLGFIHQAGVIASTVFPEPGGSGCVRAISPLLCVPETPRSPLQHLDARYLIGEQGGSMSR